MRRARRTRPATPADLSYLLDLQRRHSNAIGFLPRAAFAADVDAGHVLLATENDDAAGYVLCRPPSRRTPHLVKIIQTAVSFDAMRRAHGLQLLERTATASRARGATIMQACVREDLDANAFFRAAGFVPVGIRTAATARAHPHVIWRRPLTEVPRRQLSEIERPYRSQGPGGRFLPTTAVDRQFVIRPPTPAEIRRLTRAA